MAERTKPIAYDGSRREGVLQALRRFIGESSPGRLLPSENAIVRKFGVSRSTANKVLNILREEGLVERQRGRGTMVAAQPVITLLLPCPDFLNIKRMDAEASRMHYAGIMRAAQECGMGVETIAVSKINDRNTMDYGQLSRINAASMVIADIWFRMLFPLLWERQAQVVMTDKEFIQYGFRQYTRRWHIFELSDRDTMKYALDVLAALGCRRIGVAGNYLLNEPHLTFNAYEAWAKEHGMKVSVMDLERARVLPRRELAAWCREERLDGVVWCGPYYNSFATIQEMLGIPEDIRVFGCSYLPQCTPEMAPFPCSISPREEMGYDAVKLLARRPRPAPVRRRYSYRFANVPEAFLRETPPEDLHN